MAKAKKRTVGDQEVTVDRRKESNRRNKAERRASTATAPPLPAERRQDQRRKVPRRRQIDPTTCERDYSNDEIEFMQALDAYKRAAGRMFPTCSEILEVIRGLGYVKRRDFDRAGAIAATLETSDETDDDEDQAEAAAS